MAKGGKGLFSSDGLLNQMRQMQEQMKAAQKELEKEEFQAEVKGGKVRVTFSGTQECKAIEIDPDYLKATDTTSLQNAIQEAVNKCLDQVRKQAVKKLGPLGGDLLRK